MEAGIVAIGKTDMRSISRPSSAPLSVVQSLVALTLIVPFPWSEERRYLLAMTRFMVVLHRGEVPNVLAKLIFST